MIYSFKCLSCEARFDAAHRIYEPHPESCPICGSKNIKRLYTANAIIYNGSGFTKKAERKAGEEE